MKSSTHRIAIAASLLLLPATTGFAQSTGDTRSTGTALPAPGIAWFGTWEQGRREAKRTGRPILLISAAPHCRNISGMW